MSKLRDLFSPRDMSQGEPWKRIAEFAFPLLIGNFAQQLYNTVDAVVVGNSKWGYTALASVGNASPVLNLLLALFVGKRGPFQNHRQLHYPYRHRKPRHHGDRTADYRPAPEGSGDSAQHV